MITTIAFREILLLLLIALVWLYSASMHKKSDQIPKEMIRMPRPVALLFGSVRPDGGISFPALIFQIIMFINALIISLENFGLLSRQEGYQFLFWSTMVIGSLILIFLMKRK